MRATTSLALCRRIFGELEGALIELERLAREILAEKGCDYGPEVERFLREHDPERLQRPASHALRRSTETHAWPSTVPVSIIQHDHGSRSLYSYGRLIISRDSEAEVEELSEQILAKVWK